MSFDSIIIFLQVRNLVPLYFLSGSYLIFVELFSLQSNLFIHVTVVNTIVLRFGKSGVFQGEYSLEFFFQQLAQKFGNWFLSKNCANSDFAKHARTP